MKKYILLLILGGMMFCVTGCWGGGGGGDDGPTTTRTITVNKSYQVSKGSSSMTFGISTIDVKSDNTFVFNCSWTAKIVSPDKSIIKDSDKGNTKMYLKDNQGTTYQHKSGSGIAYSQATFTNSTPQTGTFTFSAPGSSVKTITFYDEDNGKTIGPITVTP